MTNGQSKSQIFKEGMHDGIPIALGYLVVGFTIGIAAKNAGLSPFQSFLASLTSIASAGEYAGFTTIAANASYLEIAAITLVANARYLLMSCVFSQRFAPDATLWDRLSVGYGITDEIFGITINRTGFITPVYNYGAISIAVPGWAFGTMAGTIAGNLLPPAVLSALSVALYGMFIAIIIPPAREQSIIGILVAVSFAASFAASVLPIISALSEGTRIIILTLIIAGTAAWFFPHTDSLDNRLGKEAGE